AAVTTSQARGESGLLAREWKTADLRPEANSAGFTKHDLPREWATGARRRIAKLIGRCGPLYPVFSVVLGDGRHAKVLLGGRHDQADRHSHERRRLRGPERHHPGGRASCPSRLRLGDDRSATRNAWPAVSARGGVAARSAA